MENEINFEQELYKAFGRVKDFTLGMRIASWFYEMGRNHQEPVSEEWIEELRTKLDSLSKEDFKKVFDKYAIDFNEEPVSEELEEEIIRYIGYPQEVDEDVSTTMIRKAARHFANWQKEKMMKHAVEGVITFDYYGDGDKTYGCIAHDSFCLEDMGLKDGDKVKLIIIKEN